MRRESGGFRMLWRVDDLAARVLERGPGILSEAERAGHERLFDLYGEADDWREPLRGKARVTPLEKAIWGAAHAIIMAVSAVYFEPARDHRDNPYFMEKRNEARVALDRLRRLTAQTDSQGGGTR